MLPTTVVDGVGYYFEVFGKNYFHKYQYSNPESYKIAYPDITEFANVTHDRPGIGNGLHHVPGRMGSRNDSAGPAVKRMTVCHRHA